MVVLYQTQIIFVKILKFLTDKKYFIFYTSNSIAIQWLQKQKLLKKL